MINCKNYRIEWLGLLLGLFMILMLVFFLIDYIGIVVEYVFIMEFVEKGIYCM